GRARAADRRDGSAGLHHPGDQRAAGPPGANRPPAAGAGPASAGAGATRGRLSPQAEDLRPNMTPGDTVIRPPAHQDWAAFERAIRRFVQAWRQGARPAIEGYLPRQGPAKGLLIELIHTELELRLKGGEAARVEEYLARYPELADDQAFVLELA